MKNLEPAVTDNATASSFHNPKKPINIIGINAIDEIIIKSNPEIIDLEEDKIIIFKNRINSYLFGKDTSINDIIKDENIIEFFFGLRIIILDENIHDISELDIYVQERIASFNPNIICGII